VKGLDKLTYIRLAEVLTQRGAVNTDAITEALYAQDKSGESFVDVLIGGGHTTEWDLAKIVVEHFQLPFVMPSSYDISDEARAAIPKEAQFRHLLVPLDKFEDVLTIVMPILTPFEVIDKLSKQLKFDIFPYVGLVSENRKVIGEQHKDYAEWKKADDEARAKATKRKPGKTAGEWMNIFDVGDAAVRDANKK
jgi:hypothetical protein